MKLLTVLEISILITFFATIIMVGGGKAIMGSDMPWAPVGWIVGMVFLLTFFISLIGVLSN